MTYVDVPFGDGFTAKGLDLGSGHTLRFVGWHPDRDLNPQYAGVPDVEKYAAIVRHDLRADDEQCIRADLIACEGAITFAGEVQARIDPGRTGWTVESWEPLTISPSLLCHCGDHGFIQQGRWVVA